MHDLLKMGNYKVVILITISTALMAFDLILNKSLNLINYDKYDDAFFMGRNVGGIHFIIFYTLLLLRMMVFNRKRSLKVTYYLLTGFWCLTLLSYMIVYFIEGSDSKSSLSFVHGMKSIIPAASIIMAYTPFFIPYRVLSGSIFFHQSTGNKDVDQYLASLKENEDIEKETKDVLILEDDFNSASDIYNFFNQQNMKCFHASSIAEADHAFKSQQNQFKIIILENYINAKHNEYKTGLEWARSLNQIHPKCSRGFQLITITGHPHFLNQAEEIFDLILQKPLNATELKQHLLKEMVLKK